MLELFQLVNGDVIGLVKVGDNSEILLIDIHGKIIRISPKEVRTMGRQAQGVRLIRLDADQELSSVVAFEINPEDLAKSEGGDSADFESGDSEE